MGEGQVDVPRPLLLDDAHPFGDRAGRQHLVIHQDHVLVDDIADDRRRRGARVVAGTALFDEGQRHSQLGGEVAPLLGETQVNCRHDGILQILLDEVVAEQVEGGQHVTRDGVETLDLAGVQVDRHVAVGASDLDHVRKQAGGDRDSGLILLVRASVGHVGNHGRDAAGRITFQAVDHDQQFHDIAMQRRAHRLDHVHVLAAHAPVQADEQILVRELHQVVAAERDLQVGTDLLGKLQAGRSREQLDVPVAEHLSHVSPCPSENPTTRSSGGPSTAYPSISLRGSDPDGVDLPP